MFRLIACLVLLCAAPLRAADKPNIILILADDLGYGDLGCYGNTRIRTPHLDRLAREGIRFTDFYAAGLQCTPSRAGLLTGRYPVRFGLTFALMEDSGQGLPATEVTLPSILREAGYATALIGKWHLGDAKEFRPTRRGFDLFEGLLCGNDIDPKRYWRAGQVHDDVPPDQFTARFTRASIDFITASPGAKRPFFLMLATTAVHAPIAPGPAFKGRSKAGLYADTVKELDDAVGQILKTLDDLKIDQNTLVLFTSDNGPPVGEGTDGASTGGLRGGKFSPHEGGIRVPAIARWKGTLKPRVESTPAIHLDWLPTLAGIAAAKLPADRPPDGLDLSPLLLHAKPLPDRPLYFYFPDKLQAVRLGDWKLMRRPDDPAIQLFNLKDDPTESTDQSARHPDTLHRLRDLMTRHPR